MKGRWLGQAGYLFTAQNGMTVMVDPYLSDTLEEKNGEAYKRQVPVSPAYEAVVPDVLLLTHAHEDHMDFGTLDRILTRRRITVAGPRSVWAALRSRYTMGHEYILVQPGPEVTLEDIRIRTIPAFHSDEYAVGYLLEADGKRICHTGDTLYNCGLTEYVRCSLDALLLPVNGKGNNMNAADAARLFRKWKPERVYPMHWDMFAEFGCDPKLFLEQCTEEERQTVVIPGYDEDFLV